MSPACRLILQYLIVVEPVVTAGALFAWIRAGKWNSGMPVMRDYLAVRTVNTAINISLLLVCIRSRAGSGSWQQTIYLYEYWIGFFIQAWFMLRVAGEALQQFLGPLLGLRALGKTVFRWVLVAAMLFALPAGVALAIVFVGRTDNMEVVFRFIAVISIAQVFAIGSIMIVGLSVGRRARGRAFAILLASCLEPMATLATNWFHVKGVLIWTNLIMEIVCYVTLGLWTWYAFHPDREDRLPRPNATLQHWDQIARRALRHRLPEIEEEEAVIQGARPWPQPRK